MLGQNKGQVSLTYLPSHVATLLHVAENYHTALPHYNLEIPNYIRRLVSAKYAAL